MGRLAHPLYNVILLEPQRFFFFFFPIPTFPNGFPMIKAEMMQEHVGHI